jgi:Dolichyl-phosphate-mannose-protein mannosyltransferase
MPSPAGRRAASFLLEPRGFAVLLVAYLAVHVLLRLTLSTALTDDEARDAFFAQSLEWGYLPKQPPLYNWLVLGAFRLLGIGLLALTLVKYLLLGLVYGLVYLCGRRLLRDARLAALAAFPLLLTVPVSWVVHELLTHTVAALAATAATFYALLRLEAAPGRATYLAFGVVLALGLLSKFSYLFFAAAFLLAALTVPAFRARLLDRRILLSLLVALALVWPYWTWFVAHRLSLAAMYAEEVNPVMAASYLGGVASGLYYLARVTVYFLVPLAPVLFLLFPGAWTARGALADSPPGGRLLERFLLVELGLLVGGALIGGVTYLKFRWVMPVYLLAPLYAFTRVDRLADAERGIRRLAWLLVATECAVLVAFAGSIWRGDFLGKPSPLDAPYDRVADAIEAAGFRRGTIVTGGGSLAGNLRLRFPDSRVIRVTNAHYVPPRRPAAGESQCLLAWEPDLPERLRADPRRWATATLGVTLGKAEAGREIDLPFHYSRRARFRVAYILLDGGSGECR